MAQNDEFRSTIELQKGHLYQLVDMNLCFSCVAMDIWYFSKNLTDYIEHLGKDWIAQSKSNRLVKSKGLWISLKKFGKKMVNKRDFKVRIFFCGENKFLVLMSILSLVFPWFLGLNLKIYGNI